MPFCKNCGNEISENVKFCGKCGQPVNTAAAVPPPVAEPSATPPPQTLQHPVHMVLNVSKKEGFMKRTSCYLVFYPDRLTIAHISSQRTKQEMAAQQQRIKAEGKGFFKGAAEMMRFWSDFGNRYYQMNPDQVENEDPSNFSIYHEDVSRFMFRTPDRKNRMNDTTNTSNEYGDLEIRYNGGAGKLKATHQYHDSNKNIRTVLESLYGNRLKFKGVLFSFQIGGDKNGFH